MSYITNQMLKSCKKRREKLTIENAEILTIENICPSGIDKKWIYLVTNKTHLKVGVSSNPIQRCTKLKTPDCELLAIGTPHESVSFRSEANIHRSLNNIRTYLEYTDGVISSEWFLFDLYKVIPVIKDNCNDFKWVNKNWLSINI